MISELPWPGYGPQGLKLLESGKSAAETLQQLTEADSRRATRQVGIVDARGHAATFTGTNCNAWVRRSETTN